MKTHQNCSFLFIRLKVGFLIQCLACRYVVAKVAGFKEPQRRAISIEVGMQNSSLGVVLATAHFASPLTAVPAAVSAMLMNIMGSGLAVLWRNISFGNTSSPPAEGHDQAGVEYSSSDN